MNDLTVERIQQAEEAKRLGVRAMYRIPARGGPPEFTYFHVVWPSMKDDITFTSLPGARFVFTTDNDGVPYYQWVEDEVEA